MSMTRYRTTGRVTRSGHSVGDPLLPLRPQKEVLDSPEVIEHDVSEGRRALPDIGLQQPGVFRSEDTIIDVRLIPNQRTKVESDCK